MAEWFKNHLAGFLYVREIKLLNCSNLCLPYIGEAIFKLVGCVAKCASPLC